MWKRIALVCLMLSLAHAELRAEDGVSATEILLGQSGGFSGITTGQGAIYTKGMQLWLDHVNRNGGVYGRKIVLRSLDDAQDPKKAMQNTSQLIEKDKVFALVGYTQSSAAVASMPIAESRNVPFFAPYTGTDVLYAPERRMVFTTRASFMDELRFIVRHLATLGIHRIGLLYYDLDSGREMLRQTNELLAKEGLPPAMAVSMKYHSSDGAAAAEQMARHQPKAVIIGASGYDAAAFLRTMKSRHAGVRPFYYARAIIGPDVLRAELGADSFGVAVTQTAPNPYKAIDAISKEYRSMLAKSPGKEKPDYISFEGFIAAKVLVSALEKAGRNPTRESFISALESMRELDIGGYVLRYAKNNHHGSKFVDITMIGRDGRTVD